MSENDNDEKPTFKVNDKRALGSDREDSNQRGTIDEDEGNPTESLGGVNFTSFVLSLSTSAMVHMGLTENPMTKQKEVDLEVAKHEIQIIEMLQTKTEGNLTEDEERLVGDVLFHLRMKYIEQTKA